MELIDRVVWIVFGLYLTLKTWILWEVRQGHMHGRHNDLNHYTEKGMSSTNQTLKEKQKINFVATYGWTTIQGVFRKWLKFLNSVPTITESALWLWSAPSIRFRQQTAICPDSLWELVVELHPLNWACAQTVRWISDKVTVVWKQRPFKVVLSLGNRKKSAGIKSGE